MRTIARACVHLVLVSLGVLGAAAPSLSQPVVHEFPLPEMARNIVAGPDGAIWFTSILSSYSIGRIETAWPNTVTIFPVPGAGYIDSGIAVGGDGNIWFTDTSRVGRVLSAPPYTIDAFPVSTTGLSEIAAGGDGNLWFFTGGGISRIEVAPPHTITTFAGPPGGNLLAGPDGNIWWISGGMLYRIEMTSPNTITSFSDPAAASSPFLGPDGKFWYGGPDGSVGWFDPLPPHDSDVYLDVLRDDNFLPGGTAGPDGNLWFKGTDWFSSISPTAPTVVVTDLLPPGEPGNILDLTTGPDGNLWYTPVGGEDLPFRIGRIVLTPLCTGVVCTALDQCHDVGICDPMTGGCSNPPKADGTACSGSNACAEPDSCQIGLCTDAVCVSESVPPGGTASTDSGGGTTPERPVQTSVTVPSGGTVDITQTVPSGPAPGGFAFAGQQITIDAPAQTAASPLTIVFEIDASRIPEGVDPAAVDIYRDGVPLPPCTGAPGVADPDPCISGREVLAGGDLRVTARTSAPSLWFATVPRCQSPSQIKVGLMKVNTDPDPVNDNLMISTSVTLPASSGFATLDPEQNGLQALLYDAAGGLLLDAALPSGAYGGAGTRGWQANKSGTIRVYRDKTETPLQGIIKVIVADQSKRAPNLVKVQIVGKKSTYPVDAGDPPLRAAVIFGGPEALAGRRCGETAFTSGECEFNGAGNALKCAR